LREALESELELVSISLAFDMKIRFHTFSADHVMKLSFVRPPELLIPAIGTLTKTTKRRSKAAPPDRRACRGGHPVPLSYRCTGKNARPVCHRHTAVAGNTPKILVKTFTATFDETLSEPHNKTKAGSPQLETAGGK
jgi:hypothetical protein